MAQYLVLYYDRQPRRDKLEQLEQVAELDRWSREISNAVLDGGSPTLDGKKITRAGTETLTAKSRVTNYCIIEADSPKEAAELARGAPPIYDGGCAEVYELLAATADEYV